MSNTLKRKADESSSETHSIKRTRRQQGHQSAMRQYRNAAYLSELQALKNVFHDALTKECPEGDQSQKREFVRKQERVFAMYRNFELRITRHYGVKSGRVIVFGDDESSQLGVYVSRENDNSEVGPTLLEFFDKIDVVQICTQGTANAALTVDGRVYTWGGDGQGALGRETTVENIDEVEVSIPGEVTGFKNKITNELEDETILQVAAGEGAFVYLTKAGNIYMHGMYRDYASKMYKEPYAINPTYEDYHGFAEAPVHIASIKGVLHIFSGCTSNAVAAVMEDHSLMTFGFGDMGNLARSGDIDIPRERPGGIPDVAFQYDENNQLRDEVVANEFLTPKRVRWAGPIPYPQNKRVVNVAMGIGHILVAAHDVDGSDVSLYAAGLNANGQLGLGDFKTRLELVKVPGISNVTQVAAGEFFSLVLAEGGKKLYSFGKHEMLGRGKALMDELEQEESPGCPTPGIVTFPGDTPVILSSIACGQEHGVAVSVTGDLYTWGSNIMRQTGHEKDTIAEEAPVYRPTRLNLLPAIPQAAKVSAMQVSAGCGHTVTLVEAEN